MKKLLLSLALAAVAAGGIADHHNPGDGAKPDAATMSEDAFMAAMMKAATPGEAHARLAEGVGEFVAETEMYGPDGAPSKTTMTMERSVDLGGRVIVERWRGVVMGRPFEGYSRTGYDNVTGRYWSTWTDNWSTGLLVMHGDWDAEQEALVLTGTGINPVTGDKYAMRSVASQPAPGVETMVMYEDHGQGEYKSMSFTMTRR